MPAPQSTSPLILIVEDERHMRRLLRAFLSGAGYRTAESSSGKQAIELAIEKRPDLVILDLGLPDIDGQEVIQKLREWFTAPIIVLSVRSQDVQKILALDHGADDYLPKPFSTGELLARIRVAFRNAARREGRRDDAVYESNGLRVDFGSRRVFVDGEEVRLTPVQYKLLTVLIQNCGRVMTHQQLLKEVWGPDDGQRTQLLRVTMAGLRRKIEADAAQPAHLLTEQGVGYRLAISRDDI
jgi:two-component system KDP operon response regulator KdpE